MKVKTIVLIILFLGLLKNSSGQQASLAIAVGPTFSKPFAKNTLEPYRYSNYSDGTISMIGHYKLNPKWGILMDLGISNRGMVVKQPVILTDYNLSDGTSTHHDATNKYRYSFSYLDKTLMTRYTTGNKVKVYGNAGLYYSVLLKAKKLIVDEYYDTYGDTKPGEVHSKYANHLNYAYRKSDFGFAVGAGVQSGRFGLDYRYYIGLMQVSKFSENISIYSSYSTLKLTYVFLRLEKEQLTRK